MSNRLISVAVTTFIVAASGSAFAADMAVKPPPPAPAPVPTWTGWYVGGNVGASFGDVKADFSGAPITVTQTTSGGFATFTPGIGGPDKSYPSGFMGGGQIGYNWQYSPLIVIGLEADFQGAVERESNTLTNNFLVPFTTNGGAPGGGSAGGTSATNYTTQIDWFGTVRGRIGYVWGNGEVLSYVTGGLAYGEVKINGANTTSGVVAFAPFSVTQAFGHSQVNTGWTVGTGTEGKLLIPGWTYKIESLYMDLGHLDTTGVITGASATGACTPCAITAGQATTHTHFTDWILRAGVNYQFH